MTSLHGMCFNEALMIESLLGASYQLCQGCDPMQPNNYLKPWLCYFLDEWWQSCHIRAGSEAVGRDFATNPQLARVLTLPTGALKRSIPFIVIIGISTSLLLASSIELPSMGTCDLPQILLR